MAPQTLAGSGGSFVTSFVGGPLLTERNEILVHKGKTSSIGARKAVVSCQHHTSVSRLEFSREKRKRDKYVWRRLRGLDREQMMLQSAPNLWNQAAEGHWPVEREDGRRRGRDRS